MKKWDLLNNFQFSIFNFQKDKLTKILLENREIKTKKQREEFLNPKLESLTPDNLNIDKKELSKTLKRIKKAIEKKELIVIFGDYDTDGVSGTAILWETLSGLKAKAMPYIPDRLEEGYGLSRKGIENLRKQYGEVSLIITVDNGIVANEPVEFANSLGIDVIITDHHVPSKKLPRAFAIVHSTKICGAAVGWFLSRFLEEKIAKKKNLDKHLELAGLATVADMMQLTSFNRALVKFGLEQIKKTKRPGLLSLFKLAGIDQNQIGVYELGHIIAPRINAMGRLEHAMDSLRLLCTTNAQRASDLAERLNLTNKERQQLTMDSFIHARDLVGKKNSKKLIFIADKLYEPGVIGLIAGKLTEEYYRPAIVVSRRENYSKASARSVSGFNIIEFIRLSSHLLVDAGGHPGAAGFTVETEKIGELQALLEKIAEKQVRNDLLVRKLKIDCELDLDLINAQLFDSINKLAPFGYGNPEPVFLSKGVTIVSMQIVGQDGKHLKIRLRVIPTRSDLDIASNQGRTLNAGEIGGIMFNFDSSKNLKIGDIADVVYSISQNEWNGNKRIELKIKDLRLNSS